MIGREGYSQVLTTKVVRRKHLVKFYNNISVKKLIGYLQQVPEDATVDEVLTEENTKDGTISIEFYQEEILQ